MSTFEEYYEQNPIGVLDKNKWTWIDPSIQAVFDTSSIFTPLVEWAPMPNGAPDAITGRQAIAGHVNHNPIGLRQKFVAATYFDSRERKIVADKHFASKVQFDRSTF